MYTEFLDQPSHPYQIKEKTTSESISSDGEFAQFKYYDLIPETDTRFVNDLYQQLLITKYLGKDFDSKPLSFTKSKKQKTYLLYKSGKYIDDDLLQ